MLKWVISDSSTGFYLTVDLFDSTGAVFSSSLLRATRFSNITQARDIVLRVCNENKKLGKKLALRIDQVQNLSRRNRAAFFRSVENVKL